jgi:hypothetical protein
MAKTNNEKTKKYGLDSENKEQPISDYEIDVFN